MIRFSPKSNRANLIPWREWGEEAFREAEAHDKPVMLFLSAFWCRYCQRMDEDAFSQTENSALKNPSGGYYDISTQGPTYLKLPLSLIEQNGPAASFLLALAETTGALRYREAALWALSGFTEDFSDYGIYAAAFGQALGEYLNR